MSVDVSWGFPVQSRLDSVKERIRELTVPWPVTLADTSFSQSPVWLGDYMGYGDWPSLLLIDPEGRVAALKMEVETVSERVRQIMDR